MTMHVEMSDNVADLIGALVLAQGGMDTIRKEKTNPAFKSKYADLATVLEAVSPSLTKNGIAVLQPISTGEAGEALVTTMLIHKSGQFIRSTVTLRPTQATPQGFGSAVSYGRRYGLLAMLGVAPDDDDDGNAASNRYAPPRQSETPPRAETKKPEAKVDVTDAIAYIAEWQTYLSNEESEQAIRATWTREKPQRAAAGLTDMQIAEMMSAMKERFEAIRAGANLLMAGE